MTSIEADMGMVSYVAIDVQLLLDGEDNSGYKVLWKFLSLLLPE
jgi:hypothetical protein